jgi:hypothetical protein
MPDSTYFINNVTEFKHQSVRDLAWAIASPPLITNLSHQCLWQGGMWYQRLYEGTLPWLIEIDADPAELDELLSNQKDRRMGKYFETLWSFWLRHCPFYEVVENNIQIIIDGETLGEIDFILFDKVMKKTVHWEVAVKFYLGVGDTRLMCNWHGPNLRDRLDVKVEHLMHRQSVISKDTKVARWLKQQGLVIDACAVVLKGRLYFPWLSNQTQDRGKMLPVQCFEELSYGHWFKKADFEEVFDEKQCFELLINQGWMEKIPTNSTNVLYSKRDIYEAVSDNVVRFPLHLQVCDPFCIRDRVFLVDDNWPQINA